LRFVNGVLPALKAFLAAYSDRSTGLRKDIEMGATLAGALLDVTDYLFAERLP